jgi:hypothetical protein
MLICNADREKHLDKNKLPKATILRLRLAQNKLN